MESWNGDGLHDTVSLFAGQRARYIVRYAVPADAKVVNMVIGHEDWQEGEAFAETEAEYMVGNAIDDAEEPIRFVARARTLPVISSLPPTHLKSPPFTVAIAQTSSSKQAYPD